MVADMTGPSSAILSMEFTAPECAMTSAVLSFTYFSKNYGSQRVVPSPLRSLHHSANESAQFIMVDIVHSSSQVLDVPLGEYH